MLTQAVEGTLYYIPLNEIKRVRGAVADKYKRADIVSEMCRMNVLYMIGRAGSGHIGSSFSSMEIFTYLMTEELKLAASHKDAGDVFFSSKGHDAPGYYSVMMAMERLPFEWIHKLRRIDGLPGHPDVGTKGIVTNTGSLGMGVSKAKGMIFANRLAKRDGKVFLLTGDGEIQEGQFWESLVSAVNFGLSELVVIIDHNKIQSDTFVKNVSDLGDLEAKLKSFGWCVGRCDGNDIEAFDKTLKSMENDKRPKIIIADTVKGKGVSFMEHTSLDSDVAMYKFHSGAPDAGSYSKAAQEIMDRINAKTKVLGIADISFETNERDAVAAPSGNIERLIPAYTDALIAQANKNKNVVALDADLILDTGLIPFKDKFPERFFECGIAEQDMVSVAGGMALKGIVPVVHSFACFLSSRPNEQIYNNATEHTKVVYVGSLAGVVPGGPGHSHQAVRDIASLSGIPGFTILEPSCAAEVAPMLDWCIDKAEGSSYLRLVSLPWERPEGYPAVTNPERGKGLALTEGSDAAVITYGPVMLNIALKTAQKLKEEGKSVKVINLPWLNCVDRGWLENILKGVKKVICLDNHYADSGQGLAVAAEIAKSSLNIEVVCKGVDGVPPSGTNQQVLDALELSADGLAKLI